MVEGCGRALRYGNHTLAIDRRWAGITVGLVRTGARLAILYGTAEIDTLIVPR